MAEPLKYMYNEAFLESFTTKFLKIYPGFKKKAYLQSVLSAPWDDLELKDRMRHLSRTLQTFLTGNYETDIITITDFVLELRSESSGMSFLYMFIPDYIEQFGINYFDLSMDAIEKVTSFASCEFAIRPFLIKYPEASMRKMLEWSKHGEEGVRRFASEGCRPKLPWAMAVPHLKQNPTPILTILENLKDDSSEFVRRSVANNLNDISKDHPKLFLKLVAEWKGKNSNRDKLLKHASRTLLKKGEPIILELFGYRNAQHIAVNQFIIQDSKVKINQKLTFSFDFTNHNDHSTLIRLEYAIYYLLKNGTHAKKVFKISEKEYEAGANVQILRNHPFKVITTRTFYPGEHFVSLIINGIEQEQRPFTLVFE